MKKARKPWWEAFKTVGNEVALNNPFPDLNIAPGQAFGYSKINEDREIVLNYYFNNGFPDATFEASAKRSPDDPNRRDVTYTIHPGDQVIVDQVFVAGLNQTRSSVVQREIQVKPRDPLSQIEMLNTQKSLYDLGIFSQVDTAVQNPASNEREKNVLVNVQEAKRYTFNYGLGLEFQTGQPTVNGTNPLGDTGVSPRVSFGVTRLNFRGLNHTIVFKTNIGRLQQRGLISYDAPRLFNNPKWRLTFTTFYDNTVDVTTFTSQRLEGSVAAEQTISKASIMTYRLTYRRVKANDISKTISNDQIPLLSLPTRVGIPNFSYIRNKRDNDLESTKGNYTTIDGGVAGRYFGSETDFGRLLIQNSTYSRIWQEPGKEIRSGAFHAHRSRNTVRKNFHAPTRRGVQRACSGRAVVSASGRALLCRGRKLAPRIRIEPGWATRPHYRLSFGWNRVVRE